MICKSRKGGILTMAVISKMAPFALQQTHLARWKMWVGPLLFSRHQESDTGELPEDAVARLLQGIQHPTEVSPACVQSLRDVLKGTHL